MPSLSLDRVRVFVAVVEAGGFSAAARTLNRSQSAVSHAVAELEADLGVMLFDRSGWKPSLTQDGRALLSEARRLIDGATGLLARARDLAGGIEAQLSVAVDALVPQEALATAVASIIAAYPATALRIDVAALAGVARAVLEERCDLALTASYPMPVPGLERERIGEVPMGPVVAPSHPLARLPPPVPQEALADHVQLILSDPFDTAEGPSFGVRSQRAWRLADLSIKHLFLLEGFGWGNMPLARVRADLEAGRLVCLVTEALLLRDGRLPVYAAHRVQAPPGRVARAFIAAIRDALAFEAEPPA